MTNVNHRGRFSFIIIPLLIILLLLGVFSLVSLRSNIKAIEYDIAMLDSERMGILKERKMLMAEKASILSLQNIKHTTEGKLGLTFPDRVKVFYVKKGGSTPYKISMENRNVPEP